MAGAAWRPLRAKPEDASEQYGRLFKGLQQARSETMLELAPKPAGIPASKGRNLMLSFRQA